MGQLTAAVSVASHDRLARARRWLAQRQPAEEVLVVAATLDAANEAHRMAVGPAGAAFGWHRLSFAQLAATLAAPLLAERGLVPLSRLGMLRAFDGGVENVVALFGDITPESLEVLARRFGERKMGQMR